MNGTEEVWVILEREGVNKRSEKTLTKERARQNFSLETYKLHSCLSLKRLRVPWKPSGCLTKNYSRALLVLLFSVHLFLKHKELSMTTDCDSII